MTNHHKLFIEYFTKNPTHIFNIAYTKLADIIGIKDYRSVKRFINTYLAANPSATVYSSDVCNEQEFTNISSTSTPNYPTSKKLTDDTILTLEEYCTKYHIPFDKVTSVKFVNHNGQAAWNAVCDLTKISETHLNEYFDKLKVAISSDISAAELPQAEANDQSYWFLLSDKHVGAKTNDTAMFGNYYDIEVFRQRMLSTLDDYIDEAAQRGRFDKVFICDLGDSLDGWDQSTTRPGSKHVLPQNSTNRESFDAYVRVTIEFMESLIALDLANEYEIVAITNDNHSSDFGYICNRAVEVYLNVKYPQVKTRILSKFIEHVTYGEHTVMLCHGKDAEHMRNGLPLNIDQKTEAFINSYIDMYKLTGTLHFIKGDLHQASTNYVRKFRYRNVLSLYGSSDWAQTNFGPSLAGCSSEIIYKHKNKVVTLEQHFMDSQLTI